ncbi:hypothetical protein JZ751_024172 [Albula glossodonta]|uniref:Uncharacterized protein n=1 Tax=Albula glossodonta TaxID=121402 RepID=A0A8T2NJK4_9TELE|nr:hypothetical protein JZ751_024172 [Albula glossodonta]
MDSCSVIISERSVELHILPLVTHRALARACSEVSGKSSSRRRPAQRSENGSGKEESPQSHSTLSHGSAGPRQSGRKGECASQERSQNTSNRLDVQTRFRIALTVALKWIPVAFNFLI